MIPLETWKTLSSLQKFLNLGKIIVATGFEKLPNLVTLPTSNWLSDEVRILNRA